MPRCPATATEHPVLKKKETDRQREEGLGSFLIVLKNPNPSFSLSFLFLHVSITHLCNLSRDSFRRCVFSW